ncbi:MULTISPECIES: YARHG domain-containing protein [Chryseobacterium]|uniref:YARHG domain-containing protein n=1 Tax=Chryseobacterium TaxID=59732 RepID=UPI0004821E28|nr:MULTISPECIES: YARHG domain-containing protein [Chryseobacterium]ATN07317.1 YARHG domain-containing protein [Chryseobacterium indologenes]AYY83935.1 YARHG domain-containing protein [Chryseobacterium indologenes]QIX80868.1 YARHG domain-containing protein [Chryseobacterium indologenes]TLX27554.1 YARHG domain-containing protein [Chryseobacterium indologenes]UDQ54546.1 YARHG domain-containing protein [Chryseobacterium indologenes]
MKTLHYTLISALALSLLSCKKDGKTNESGKDSLTAKKDSVVIPEVHKEYYGIYTGDFAGMEKMIDDSDGTEFEASTYKKISLKINRITKDSVYGQSIVNGNQRPFRGVFNEASKSFVLDEPGNDKTDGRFEVKLSGDSLTGKWNAFNKTSVKSPVKTLKLTKKEFVYNPNFMLDKDSNLVDWSNPKDFVEKYTDDETGKTESYTTSKNRVASEAIFKLNASKQKLTEKDLKNLRKLDLEIIKNSVFARHGYSFKKETYRNFFEQTDWYIPVSNNVDNELSPLEKENVALLNRFTQYAEDKYDSFGR